jgi:hypothetical protein
MARIDKNFIQSPSAISCILEINGTDYIKKKRFIYYGKCIELDSVTLIDYRLFFIKIINTIKIILMSGRLSHQGIQ